jgi:hypothetical protein
LRSKRKARKGGGWLIFPVAFAPLFLVLFGFSVLLLYLVSFFLGIMILVWGTSCPCDPMKIRHSRFECEHALRLLSRLAQPHVGATLKRQACKRGRGGLKGSRIL